MVMSNVLGMFTKPQNCSSNVTVKLSLTCLQVLATDA